MRSKIISAAIVVLIVALSAFLSFREDRTQRDNKPVQVHSMDVTLELARQDAVKVTELIQVEIPEGNRNHGIFRTLPVSSRRPARMAEAPFLHVLEAAIDGKPCRTDDLKAHFGTENVTVYLRDKKAWLAPGMHAFKLVYEMTGMTGFAPEEDSIRWNVTGAGWERGVLAASCTIVPAEGAPLSHGLAFLGSAGSTDSPVDFAEAKRGDKTCFVFTAKTPVRQGHHFTVGASFPKGTVPEPALYRPEEDRLFTGLCAGTCLLSLLLSFFLWWRWGRDPKKAPVAPLFTPPRLPQRLDGKRQAPNLSPAQVHYLANDCRLDSKGLGALFLSLDAKGRCQLSGNAKEGYSVTRLAPSPNQQIPLSPEEEAALEKLPEGTTAISKDNASLLQDIKSACSKALDKDFGTQFLDGFRLRFASFAVPLFLLAAIQLFHTQLARVLGPAWPSFPWNALKLVGALFAFAALLPFMAPRQIDMAKPLHWLTFPMQLIFAFLILPLIVLPTDSVIAAIFSPVQTILPSSTPLQAACFFGAMLWPFLFAPFMQSKTRELADLQTAIAGFGMYIKAAEAPRLNTMNPPEENIALYTKMLPYASALGLEKAWARRFENKLASFREKSSVHHVGFVYHNFSPDGFSSAVSSSCSTSSSGGGAGSGGGGGGGGGC